MQSEGMPNPFFFIQIDPVSQLICLSQLDTALFLTSITTRAGVGLGGAHAAERVATTPTIRPLAAVGIAG